MATNQLIAFTPETTEVYKPEVLAVIRNSFCANATDPEFVLFAHKCAAYRLDPFKNEIFFIKYGNVARIQFAAAAYLNKAREKEGFQPPDTQIVCEKDEFKARKVKGQDGKDEWEIVEHEISFPRGKIVGAYSIAYRDGYRPVTVFVEKEHISHVYIGQNKDNWNKWEPDMIGKFCEQRSLSKQYGLDLNDDEVGGSATADVGSYERKDITQEAAPLNQQQAPEGPKTEPKQSRGQRGQQADDGIKPLNDDQPDLLKEKIKQVASDLKKLSYTTKEERDKYIDRKLEGKQLTDQNINKLLGMIALDLEDMEEAARSVDGDGLPGLE